MFKRFGLGLVLALGLLSGPALAQSGISSKVAVCNPSYPSRCVAVAADGSIPTTGGGGGGGNTTVTATAAAPTYVEGSTTNPLSVMLKGGLRVTPQDVQGDAITDSTNDAMRVNVVAGGATGVAQGSTTSGQLGALSQGAVTTSAPTYTTGTTNPLSIDTSGGLRVAPHAVTQSGTWNITNVSGTVSLPTGAATAALQGVQGTGSTYNPPTGGSGEIGYLSGIYAAAIDTTPVVVNQTQINGTTLLAGNGATGTGSPRVTVANDNSPIPTKIDQTTPGTTNGVRADTSGATASAVPARADYMGVNTAGNLVGLIQAGASVAINVSTATTTQLVALSGSTKIYVTALDVISGGTGNITFVYGTGSSCGTGTTNLTGAYNLTAQTGLAKGNGLGPVLVVPAGNALCVTTSAAVQMSGSVAYTQF